MEEDVENKEFELNAPRSQKKYVTSWRSKWITSKAGSIDDFIATYERLAEKMKRWKEEGIILDLDGGVGDDYAQFYTYDEKVAIKEEFEEEIIEEYEEEFESNLKFQINEYLTLVLSGTYIQIYVNGEPFNQCRYLLIVDPLRHDNQDEIGSIDEAQSLYNNNLEREIRPEELRITKEQEFWAHCSNMQTWAEHDYDTRLLHSNLSFPLLKKLTEVGDMKAKKIFKDEIGIRFASGFLPVIQYLFREKYVDYLTLEEFSIILDELDYIKLGLNELLEGLYDYYDSKYGYLFLSRVQKEFSDFIMKERVYVEAVTHYLEASEFCPLVITPDCQHFIRGSNDGKLKEFSLFTGDLVRTFGHHPLYVRTVAISRDGKFVASSSDNIVEVWDYETGKLYYSLEGHNDFISSLAFDPDGRYLLSGSNGRDNKDYTIKIWHLEKKELHATLDSHWGRINSLSFSSDGKYMVSAANDKTVNVWNATVGRLITTLVGHKKRVSDAIITNNKKVVSSSFDDTIKIWDIDSEEMIKEIDISGFKNDKNKYHIVSCQLTPDQRFIIAVLQDPLANNKGYLSIWRLSDGKLVQNLPIIQENAESSEPLLHLAVSPEGHFIIGTFQSKKVRIWMEFMEFMSFQDIIQNDNI